MTGTPFSRPADVAQGFRDAWNRMDADALAALFTEDADFVNVVGMWWRNRRQIRFNHAYGFRRIFAGSVMSIDRLAVRELGDVAVVHVDARVRGQTAPDGRPAGDRLAHLSFVVARQPGGGWLAVSAQNTDRVPGAQTNLAEGDRVWPVRYDPPAEV